MGSSVNPVLVSSSLILTATVSSSAGTPTGSVSSYDETALLGSATLAGGIATYTTPSLACDTQSITAVYAGDSSFLSVTSSSLSQVVSDLAVALAGGGARSATVSTGGTATYRLTISPSTGSALPVALTLSASGGPAGSTITITPRTIAAGAGATDVTVAVQVVAASAAVRSSNSWAVGLAFPLLGLLVLPFGIECRRLLRKRVLFAALLLILLASAGAILACGNSSRPASQPTDYTLTVTATSGNITHSTALTLTMQ